MTCSNWSWLRSRTRVEPGPTTTGLPVSLWTFAHAPERRPLPSSALRVTVRYADAGTAAAQALSSVGDWSALDCTGLTMKTVAVGAAAPVAGAPVRAAARPARAVAATRGRTRRRRT